MIMTNQRKKALEAIETIKLFDAMGEMAKHTSIIRQALTEPAVPDQRKKALEALDDLVDRASSDYPSDFVKLHDETKRLGDTICQALTEPVPDAPTNHGIPELDSLCEQYNNGEIDLCALVCRAWNKALVIEPAVPDAVWELLRVAKCPACDGSGSIPHGLTPDGDWEWEQCQWCDERKRALAQQGDSGEGDD